MLLHISISSPSRCVLPLASSSYSQILSLGFRRPPPLVSRPYRAPKFSIVCSISQVHNYGTVDYERRPVLKWSALYRRISLMEDPSLGSSGVLDQWEEEGRKLSKWDLCRVVKELRKFRRFKLALEVYEWMIDHGDRFKLNSSDAAIQLDLISKVHGISSAEDYFSGLPEALKDKRTYGSLLNAYVQAKMKEKAEAVIEEMWKGGYMTEVLPYNVMMTLYMNTKEQEKVLSMIAEMKENGIPLDIYSYNIWITSYGAMGDVEKMEEVVQQMTEDSRITANWTTYSTLASMYIKHGHFEKAEKCLRDVELRITGRDRTPFNYLLSLYSNIGEKDEVYRIWNYYKSSFPSIPNMGYHSMISSLARLGDIEGAEAVYEEWLSVRSSYDPRICNILMGWYIKEGLLKKAEDFFDHMRETGVRPNPNTWEILAEGYVREKQISKALSCMKEAASIKRFQVWQPRPANVAALLVLCEEQADTVSMDMMVDVLRKAGCLDIEAYRSLVGTDVRPAMAVDGLNLGLEGNESDGDGENEMLLKQHHASL
ncbi:pentatricopeptide repeat-containing protein At1g02150-like [Magnolia sinica]|uniref:pentatricopeptide repeat-containing protein At1g02150-like n=1 Tax=Magnolia sinica TaxID=86752 RepID=UPI002657D864|nr:pentatricopeptide repeat-containing protein At1g02150-like [Magnolia sinica]